jgi:alkylation response protein AidB-like acyl-CoA dehydrogenase
MDHQAYTYGMNHWDLETDLKPILKMYWKEYSNHLSELHDFGDLCGRDAYEVADFVDQHPPELVMHDLDGGRIDRARLSPKHMKVLKDLAFMNQPPYGGDSWHHHFVLGYLLADPGLYCTLIVTNQTAYAIYKYAPDQAHWIDKLVTGEAWGATWMTETQGGSDLGANTTTAKIEKGLWKLEGKEKYFASNAGIADVALVTARPEGAQPGPKGLALFVVPRLDHRGGLNYRVRRFKRKSATRAVPTGEVELDGSQAYLVGEAEKGIYYTLETLTVSRLANAIGAMGLARKANLEALYRVNSRTAFGEKLIRHPLVRWDLTDMAVRIAGGTALIFHAVEAFDKSWHSHPPYDESYHYARFLSHLAKNRTADHAAVVTQMAMELFGGLGFLDEYAVARFHREALVTPIWEGSSNIQALDMLEVMAKKGAHEAFLDEMYAILPEEGPSEIVLAASKIQETLDHLVGLNPERAQWYSKDALATLADSAQVALLNRLGAFGGERYQKLARLYSIRFLLGEPYPAWALEDEEIWNPIAEGTAV